MGWLFFIKNMSELEKIYKKHYEAHWGVDYTETSFSDRQFIFNAMNEYANECLDQLALFAATPDLSYSNLQSAIKNILEQQHD
jgi:hypothetical protein